MTLATGKRLGPYEILSPIGAGGMGAVYSARDTRLQREVAIKVLPAEHMGDPVRRQRFQREAQTVSALNHPNIVTLHDVGESDGIHYLVMERVSGRTLDQAVPRGGLRLAETLRLAMQIADALGKAHAAGILHRDLKPANVMVTEDGAAKLLDFGVAKLVEAGPVLPDGSTDTAGGTIVGTVAYMSPEQAQGKTLDARSDIFSFGAVLYEMATGRRAFRGDSTPAVLAAVIAQEPLPPRDLDRDIPRDLERIIQRCLRKDPARRFHDISDVKVELLEVKEDSESQAAMSAVNAARWSRRRRIALLAGFVAIAAGVAATVWRARRVDLPAATVVQLSSERQAGEGSFSPDGTQIAFASMQSTEGCDIGLKMMGEAEVRRLTTDPAWNRWPAWSPDGTRIAFVRFALPVGPDSRVLPMSPKSRSPGSIVLVSPLGGQARRIDFPVRGPWWFGGQLSWSPDGRWLAAARARAEGETTPGSAGIALVPVGGGAPRAITFPQAPSHDAFPAFSPDGRAIAFASCFEELEVAPCNLHVLPLDPDLQPAGASRRLPGPPVPVQGLAWTRDGRTILYGVYGNRHLWRVRVDGSGAPARVELAGRGAVSPSTASGRDRMAYVRAIPDHDIYRLPPGAGPVSFLASTYVDSSPQYSPDGRRVAFASGRSGDAEEIWLADADGSGATRLTRIPTRQQGSPRWSPDGRTIAFDSRNEEGLTDVWTIGVDGAVLRQVTRDSANENMPSWSRDGRFLYYSSDRTGRSEIWRVPVAGGAEKRLTREGGVVPFESFDGGMLYYLRSWGGALIARPTGGGAERTVLRCVAQSTFAVGPQGIFYLDCGARPYVVRHWNATTGQDRPIGTSETHAYVGGMAVSPDGQNILFARLEYASDLMMIDNFR